MMINKKINTYKINPADGEALLNYKGRISSDDLYMQVYSIDKSKSELVNTTESNEATDGVVFDGDCLSVCVFIIFIFCFVLYFIIYVYHFYFFFCYWIVIIIL